MCRHVSIWGFQNCVRPSVCLFVPREKKSPCLRRYQSYIRNWYIIGKVFKSTTTWKCKNVIFYASPISGEAYRDRRLTTNFELWVEIFCVSTCFHVRIPKPCLSVGLSVRPSVCPHPEKRNRLSFVNISPTLVIDASMERSSRVLHHGNPKIWIFFQKSSKFDFWWRAEITLASSISVLH